MTLSVDGLEVRYGTRVALQRTSFALPPGELVALIGPNGAGKSSLLKALAGLGLSQSGEIPRDFRRNALHRIEPDQRPSIGCRSR